MIIRADLITLLKRGFSCHKYKILNEPGWAWYITLENPNVACGDEDLETCLEKLLKSVKEKENIK